jgi:hypothetical protein
VYFYDLETQSTAGIVKTWVRGSIRVYGDAADAAYDSSPYPTTKHLRLYQGDTWFQDFPHAYTAANISALGFAVARTAGGVPFYSINMADEAAQFTDADNLTTVKIPAADALLFDVGVYFYDLQATVSGAIITIARGSFTVEGHAYNGEGGGMGFATTEISERLIAWTLAQAWSFTSITRDVDGVISSASIRWPDNVAGTLTRTAKNTTWQVMTSFTVTYNALTVTQPAITLDGSGNLSTRPRPTVA